MCEHNKISVFNEMRLGFDNNAVAFTEFLRVCMREGTTVISDDGKSRLFRISKELEIVMIEE